MKFVLNKSLFKYLFVACLVCEISCYLQVVPYADNKDTTSIQDQNNVSLSRGTPILGLEGPVNTIKSNTIGTRRRRRRKRKKKTKAINESSTISLTVATNTSSTNENSLHTTVKSNKRPRRRRIRTRRRKVGKKIQNNNSTLGPGIPEPFKNSKRRNNTEYKSSTITVETKSLILPVVPTSKLLWTKENGSKVKKIEIKNTRCSKNNGGCAQVCLTKGVEKCQCLKGFRLAEDYKNCVDIDECSTNNPGCHMNCTNTIGSYRCHCPRGLRLGLDSKSCKDVNECLLRNGHGPCQDTCKNTYGGYKCNCQGLRGTELGNDLHSCVDIDECAQENGGCSHICINTFGRSFCFCPEGMALSVDFKTCQSSDWPRVV